MAATLAISLGGFALFSMTGGRCDLERVKQFTGGLSQPGRVADCPNGGREIKSDEYFDYPFQLSVEIDHATIAAAFTRAAQHPENIPKIVTNCVIAINGITVATYGQALVQRAAIRPIGNTTHEDYTILLGP